MHKNLGLATLPLVMILLNCCILSSVLPVKAAAQEEFVPATAKPLTSFPFKMLTGGIMIVEATLDDFKDTLNFVLDTGSGGISLDSATCTALT